MNKYLVSGKIMQLQRCSCEYCEGHRRHAETIENHEVKAMDEFDAIQKVFDAVSSDLESKRGFRGLEWDEYDKPIAVLLTNKTVGEVLSPAPPPKLIERVLEVGPQNFWKI